LPGRKDIVAELRTLERRLKDARSRHHFHLWSVFVEEFNRIATASNLMTSKSGGQDVPLVPAYLKELSSGGFKAFPSLLAESQKLSDVEFAVENMFEKIGEPDVSTAQTKLSGPEGDTVLLITAVGAERRAALSVMRDAAVEVVREEIEGRYFDRFSWRGRQGLWTVFLGQPTEKGPHATQALLHDFHRTKSPRLVLMIGMCGGIKEHGASEGDVIIARQVFNYEPARLRDGGSVWSPVVHRTSPRILDLANALGADGEFGDVVVRSTKDYGSGEKLVDDLLSDTRRQILALSGDIVAVEMEAPGLLHAVWEMQRTVNVNVAVIKGVSDFADGAQSTNKTERQRVASCNAMSVALKILSNY